MLNQTWVEFATERTSVCSVRVDSCRSTTAEISEESSLEEAARQTHARVHVLQTCTEGGVAAAAALSNAEDNEVTHGANSIMST